MADRSTDRPGRSAIRLVSDEPAVPLDANTAREHASAAYSRARKLQRRLVRSAAEVLDLIHRPTAVSVGRLRVELANARSQVEEAQEVVASLEQAIDSLGRAQ